MGKRYKVSEGMATHTAFFLTLQAVMWASIQILMDFKNAVITHISLVSSLLNQYQQVLNTRGGCQTSVQRSQYQWQTYFSVSSWIRKATFNCCSIQAALVFSVIMKSQELHPHSYIKGVSLNERSLVYSVTLVFRIPVKVLFNPVCLDVLWTTYPFLEMSFSL